MVSTVLIILHLLGASVWIGGHVVLVSVVLPAAMRRRDPARIAEFEQAYGKIGLAALILQTVTGVWLATVRIGDWSTIVAAPTLAGSLIVAKASMLALTMLLAGHAYHRVLPRLSAERIRPFAIHAWAVTSVSILMLVIGALIRSGIP